MQDSCESVGGEKETAVGVNNGGSDGTSCFRIQESRAAARKPRDAASVLFR